jgi:hypothetical protein
LAIAPPFDDDALSEIRADILRLRDYDRPYLEDDLSDRAVDLHHHWGRIVSRDRDPLQHR